jgi:hypothetical protein
MTHSIYNATPLGERPATVKLCQWFNAVGKNKKQKTNKKTKKLKREINS